MTTRDQKTAFYEATTMGGHTQSPPLMHLAQSKMVDWTSVPARPVVLDIGSGAGVGVAHLASNMNDPQVFCIDLSTSALNEARRKGHVPLIASAEGNRLPFGAGVFDIVVLNEVIEHLVDTDSIMDEIYRVLKPNGLLLLSTPNLASWFNRGAILFGVQPAFSEVSFRKVYGRPGSGLVGHLRLFTRRALVEFLVDAGFIIKGLGGIPFPELPQVIQPIDRLLSRFSSIAGGLVTVSSKTQGERQMVE